MILFDRYNFLKIVLFLVLFSNTYSQKNTISTKLIYITSSKIFLFPESSDLTLRKMNLPLENIFGFGIEFQRVFNESKYGIGINAEYLKKAIKFENFSTTDGYWALPVELTGYFYIPLGLEKWKIFMGCGGGIYFGNRILKKENAIQSDIKFTPGFGIHVLGGVDYYFVNNFALKSQMKFRDLFFQTKNIFLNDPPGETNNTTKEYDSKINIDGMILELGIVYSF